MKTQKIEGIKYNVPQSWFDVNLKTFLEMKNLEASIEQYDELEYITKYVSILVGIPEEKLSMLEIDEIKEILVDIEKFSKLEMPIVDTIVTEVNGRTYVQEKRTETYNLGLFTDLETIVKSDKDFWNNAHKITACFLRRLNLTKLDKARLALKKKFKTPIKIEDYKVAKYDYNTRIEDEALFMEHLPMPYIYSSVVFFLIFANNLLKITKDSSQLV